MNTAITDFLESKIGECKYFKWKEALYLPKMDIYALPNDVKILENICLTALKLDQIRDMFKEPLLVSSWYRPKEYNKMIKGSLKSMHMQGLACDFYFAGYKAQQVREILAGQLKHLRIRMEDLPKANWIHIDLKVDKLTPDHKLFFKP